MKALRLVIYQSSANYRKEETIDNKMTYPLPPLSTIIGALHTICGYSKYHEMDISIQGKYETMQRMPYTDYCFLNSLQDDRGTLVKMKNKDMISSAFQKVASSKKPQGNSFRFGKTIQVYNTNLMEEYRCLKETGEKIDQYKKETLEPIFELINRRKQRISEKKKTKDQTAIEISRLIKREQEIKEAEKKLKKYIENLKKEKYTDPISDFRILVTSLKFYEILNEIRLIIHVRAKEKILYDILEHIKDLQSIGRSEDMINVEDADIVELQEHIEAGKVISRYYSYLDYQLIRSGQIYHSKTGGTIKGTRYYLNKNYEIQKGKRIFQKKEVIYASNYAADRFENGLYLDEYKGEKMIVDFL